MPRGQKAFKTVKKKITYHKSIRVLKAPQMLCVMSSRIKYAYYYLNKL